ncbi:hypothetical protein IAT40_007291 [Kwoniella sp. CBS 6097]
MNAENDDHEQSSGLPSSKGSGRPTVSPSDISGGEDSGSLKSSVNPFDETQSGKSKDRSWLGRLVEGANFSSFAGYGAGMGIPIVETVLDSGVGSGLTSIPQHTSHTGTLDQRETSLAPTEKVTQWKGGASSLAAGDDPTGKASEPGERGAAQSNEKTG